MLTRHTRLITIVLTLAVLLALGGSTVLAQGPTFPTPVPPVKAPGGSSSSAAPAAPKAPPTVAPAAPGSKSGPAITAPSVKPAQPAAQPRTGSGAKVVPAPGGPFASAFRVQNLGTATASCSYIFYDSAGAAKYTSPTSTVAVGDSLYVYTPSISDPAFVAGQYSGVVSCDQQVAAVVNFSQGSGAGSSGDVFNGITTNAATWYAPNIFNNYYGFYTNVVVQNATGAANNITIDVYAPGSTTALVSKTASSVPAYASVSFDQSAADFAALLGNVAYSAKITGTGNVAPIVNIYGMGAVAGQLYSYNPLTGGATTVYAPVVMNNYYGYNTAITVQNVGGAATNVTVTYASGGSQTATALAANSAAVFVNFGAGSPIPAGTLTSATVTSSASNVVVLVNESNNLNRATSYIGAATGSATVRAPIVMRRYYGYNTSVTCQNVGTGATTMTIAYGSSATQSQPTSPANPIPVGGTALFYQPSDANIADGAISSATVTATGGGASIICVVNEDMNEAPNITLNMDQLYGYNAINQ